MITMTEIAKLTQVSQPTVSRVLNGSKTVSADIRERVLACAREHNYQFNALAKSLQGGKTQLLGVLLTDVSNSFFADLAKQVEAKARELGYSIILFNSDYSSAREQEYLDVVRRYRVDGVLAVPVLEGGSLWPGCAQRLDVPVVALTRQVEGLDCVYLDHVEAAAQVARHMTQRGYRRFLFIGQDGCPKCEGFRQELAARGLASQLTVLEGQDDEQLKRSCALIASGRAPVPVSLPTTTCAPCGCSAFCVRWASPSPAGWGSWALTTPIWAAISTPP